jgi:hypothetical protein
MWRGIALIDMAWVHLATYPIGMPDVLAVSIGEHTRFAAGALVLLSGLTVRRAFGRSLEGGGDMRRRSLRRLLRRAILLVLVGQLVNVAYAAIEQLVMNPSWIPSLSWNALVPVAGFRTPGVTGGLLQLYAMLLVLTPLLESLRGFSGPVPAMLVSLMLFAAAQFFGPLAHWPPWTFPLAHWQPLFVAGYLASPLVERWETSLTWLLVVTAACAATFTLRSPSALGIAQDTPSALTFTKVPLSEGELVWYAISSVCVMSWAAWLHQRGIIPRLAGDWLQALGRWSLLVYVCQLLLELPVIAFLTLVDPSPALRATMLPLMTAAMIAVATVAERVSKGRFRVFASTRRPSLRLLPPAGALGSAVAVCCAALVLFMQATIPPAPPRILTGESPDAAVKAELLVEGSSYRGFLSTLSGEPDLPELSDIGGDISSDLPGLPIEEKEEDPTPDER